MTCAKIRGAAALLAVIFSFSFSSLAEARYGETRTANRDVSGLALERLLRKPPVHLGDNYRSWSSAHEHNEQWSDARWDPQALDVEKTLKEFYEADILHDQFVHEKDGAVVEVGPKFYTLAFVDQQRVLRLIADASDFTKGGHTSFEVRDWHNGKAMGYFAKDVYKPVPRGPVK